MYSTDTRSRTLELLREIVDVADVQLPFGLSQQTDDRNLQYVEALAYRLGILDLVGPAVGTVTKSIGTTGRDYSTMTSWEADLDNTGIYSASDDAVGECYDDSAFNEAVTINGGGTVGLASIHLTAPAGQRHDGTAGTGARLVMTASNTVALATAITLTVSYLEVDHNGQSANPGINFTHDDSRLWRVIQHANARAATCAGLQLSNKNGLAVLNCIIYANSSSGNAYGIYDPQVVTRTHNIQNTTVHNTSGSTSGTNCYLTDQASSYVFQNLISTSASSADYNPSSYSTAVFSYNLSSDATSSGTGSLTNKSAANQFVSTTGGSEDLHLKTGADAIDAGTDLGTTPTGVNIDIDNRDRDALGDTWDMGADEYVAAVGGSIWELNPSGTASSANVWTLGP